MFNTQEIARQLRLHVINMLHAAGSGHTGASLGLADIFAVLYFSDVLKLNPHHPQDPHRDRVILSNGHACPIWYAALAERGYFPITELSTLRQYGSRLQGHPHKDFSQAPSLVAAANPSPSNLPGIENTAGPLGQGIGLATGLALGLKLQYQSKHLSELPRVICLCGDGELNEGQCWEAFMTASKYKLTNLIFIIDRNGIQIDGFNQEVMPLEPLKDKLSSFGLLVQEIDGHNHHSIYQSLTSKTYSKGSPKPVCIIAHTTMGKDVSFMENRPLWHGKAPNNTEATAAIKELKKI